MSAYRQKADLRPARRGRPSIEELARHCGVPTSHLAHRWITVTASPEWGDCSILGSYRVLARWCGGAH